MMIDLKKWKLACPKNGLDLIFPDEVGNTIDQSNLLKRHSFPAIITVCIEKIRFQDFCHTYASLLIEQGEYIKYIQSQLGHLSPTVTLNPHFS